MCCTVQCQTALWCVPCHTVVCSAPHCGGFHNVMGSIMHHTVVCGATLWWVPYHTTLLFCAILLWVLNSIVMGTAPQCDGTTLHYGGFRTRLHCGGFRTAPHCGWICTAPPLWVPHSGWFCSALQYTVVGPTLWLVPFCTALYCGGFHTAPHHIVVDFVPQFYSGFQTVPHYMVRYSRVWCSRGRVRGTLQ